MKKYAVVDLTVINLTPHKVVIINERGKCVFPPSGKIARVAYDRTESWSCHFPDPSGLVTITFLRESKLYPDASLPDPREGVLYIVSRDVAQHNLDRSDLIVPDTENAIRDDKGRIIGVPGFVVFAK